MEVILYYSGGLSQTPGPLKVAKLFPTLIREGGVLLKNSQERCKVAGFEMVEMEKGVMIQEIQAAFRSCKRQSNSFSTKPPEGSSPASILILAQEDSCQTSKPQNCKI